METTDFLNLAPFIEHTLLKPDTTRAQIIKLCEEALKYNFKGVCVNSHYISLAKSALKGSPINVVSVIGFPLGACHTDAKRQEAILAVNQGAHEIDMVINIGAVKDQLWKFVEDDIASVTRAVDIPVKVILETGLLNDEEIILACKAAESGGAKFVKTCTGFAAGSATIPHIELMKKSISNKLEIKASGGIKTVSLAKALLRAGATRLGTSSGVQLVTGQNTDPLSY